MSRFQDLALVTLLFLLVCALGTDTAEADSHAEPSGQLVMFLTQTDPMLAGHGMHFATRMVRTGRPATIVLVGDAGRLALDGWPANTSAVSGQTLQEDLMAFIDAGGTVFVTPYTLASFRSAENSLIDGVSLPSDPDAIHAHMFETETQLIVW